MTPDSGKPTLRQTKRKQVEPLLPSVFICKWVGQCFHIMYRSSLQIPHLIHTRRLAKMSFTLQLYHAVETVKLL
jgi:hypothetical protein